MNEGQTRILRMLEEGRITAEEADLLLEALRSAEDRSASQQRREGASGWSNGGRGPSGGGAVRSLWLKDALKPLKETLKTTFASVGSALSGLNLAGADLSGARLEGAELEGANLMGADLSDADLRDANLRNANLMGADLSGADLREANLEGASLMGADLENVDLRGQDLSGVNLTGVSAAATDLGAILGRRHAKEAEEGEEDEGTRDREETGPFGLDEED